jgi:hypothetical protein
LRATGSRERAPDDRLREAIQQAAKKVWIASAFSLSYGGQVVALLFAMTMARNMVTAALTTFPIRISNSTTISDAHPRSRGTRARVLQIDPPQIEGAGKTGCTLHPRSRVQTAHKNAHEHTGSAEAIRPSLRNGFTAYAVLSPATNSSCHRRRRINGSSKPGRASQNLRQLDTSNGCQDHTVLPYAYRRSSARCRSLTSRLRLAPRSHRAPGAAASTASQPNVRDDHDTPLFSGRDGASL